MRFNYINFFLQVCWKRIVLSTLTVLFFTSCGLKVGETPWFIENQIYDWDLPTSSECKAVEYKKTFVDFFTKENGEESVLLDSMKMAVLCLKRKVMEYKKLIRGDHEDYLTQPELKKLLNHEVVKTGIEDEIDWITEDEKFNLFIDFKDMILRVYNFSSQTEPIQGESIQKSLSEAVCSDEPKRIALYKKEVDELSEVLDLMNDWLQSIHISSKQLAVKLNDYVASEKLAQFFKENWPERELDEAAEYLLQKNLDQLDPDLRQKYLSERGAQVIRRHFMTLQSPLDHLADEISETKGSEHSPFPARDGRPLEEAKGRNPIQTEGGQDSPVVVSLPIDFFQYLQEHPRVALSIPAIRRAALLSILNNKENGIGLPGFSEYFAEQERKILEEKIKRENAEWYEKEWWNFGLPIAEKERNEMLDNLYTMTEIGRKLGSHPSHITGLDMKYLLLNASIVEVVMNVYDFNSNGSVERNELESVYCLFNSLLPFFISNQNSSTENGWLEQLKQSVANDVTTPENIFNYILEYQEIPSKEDWDARFVWASSGEGLNSDEISLSREAMVKLVSALFLKFFPEKYFVDHSPLE